MLLEGPGHTAFHEGSDCACFVTEVSSGRPRGLAEAHEVGYVLREAWGWQNLSASLSLSLSVSLCLSLSLSVSLSLSHTHTHTHIHYSWPSLSLLEQNIKNPIDVSTFPPG